MPIASGVASSNDFSAAQPIPTAAKPTASSTTTGTQNTSSTSSGRVTEVSRISGTSPFTESLKQKLNTATVAPSTSVASKVSDFIATSIKKEPSTGTTTIINSGIPPIEAPSSGGGGGGGGGAAPEEQKPGAEQPKKKSNLTLYLIIGAVVIAAGIFVYFKWIKK